MSNADQIREQLLWVINRGTTALIADMTATVSCDHAGADAVARAYQRAIVSGTQLRLVVIAQVVRRVLSLSGLDRLVSIYPAVEAAIAAGMPATMAPAVVPAVVPATTQTGGHAPDRPAAQAGRRRRPAGPPGGPLAAGITQAVLWKLIDALGDGVALTGEDGVVALANRRLEDMFGYAHDELIGHPVEGLIPADLRAAHRRYRAVYVKEPTARPMAARARLVGLRKDGTTLPLEISLSPVPTATGHFTLVVIRNPTDARQRDDLADLARAAAAQQAHAGQELLDKIAGHLFDVGLSMHTAIDLPGEVVKQRIADALWRLDDTILAIRDHVFRACDRAEPPEPAPPDVTR